MPKRYRQRRGARSDGISERSRRPARGGGGGLRGHLAARVRRRGGTPRRARGAQPLRSGADRRGLQRWLGGAGRRRRVPRGAGHRHRRLDPHPGSLLRDRRVQAVVRRHRRRRRAAAVGVFGPRGHPRSRRRDHRDRLRGHYRPGGRRPPCAPRSPGWAVRVPLSTWTGPS